jgi:hypothetical protein
MDIWRQTDISRYLEISVNLISTRQKIFPRMSKTYPTQLIPRQQYGSARDMEDCTTARTGLPYLPVSHRAGRATNKGIFAACIIGRRVRVCQCKQLSPTESTSK